ncbi:MAG: amino acid ABC transporter permease [Hyphomicrobiales bacterium]|nr:amino acid ABC transporter permease [Hyphomicrobiales bacterium]MBV8765031.1 amino acid ABC transporter permease [Hyphomicrobiales bacterium]MBV9432298.1 amino acid ABC transporter permease [Hyphomicrobiales bacterium]MBV9741424.1 amino acid ABC transporter permease [Hyphomicrobiales bacterium]
MNYVLDFGWLSQALEPIIRGAFATIFLTAVTGVLGIICSILGASAARSRLPAVRGAIESYVELIRNTPFLVQLFFIFFGLPSLGLRLDATVAAILAMTINLSAYGTEIVGAGLDAVSQGQREAGQALGLRQRHVFLKIVLPQALRVIFPALTSQIVIMMLESAVVSQIAVQDLTYEADMLQARTFRAFETYLVVTGVYLALSIVLRRVMVAGGRKLLAGGIS